MDSKLVSAGQTYEAYYIAGKYKIPLADVKAVMKAAGRSRRKIYAMLRSMGHIIKTK